MKKPIPYYKLHQFTIFTVTNHYKKYIKHSDALALDINGNAIIPDRYEGCWPKRVSGQEFVQFLKAIKEHDNEIMKEVFKNDHN